MPALWASDGEEIACVGVLSEGVQLWINSGGLVSPE